MKSDEPRPKVLVVDDSALAREATRAALEQVGLEVRVAASIGQLNAMLVSWWPTIVLLDVNMPGFDGADVCRWIKSRLSTTTTPVVLFSDMPEPALLELVTTCGADSCVSKRRGLDGVAEHVSSLCAEMVW